MDKSHTYRVLEHGPFPADLTLWVRSEEGDRQTYGLFRFKQESSRLLHRGGSADLREQAEAWCMEQARAVGIDLVLAPPPPPPPPAPAPAPALPELAVEVKVEPKPEEDEDENGQSIECPFCHALVGEACRLGNKGKKAKRPHKARVNAGRRGKPPF